MPRTSVPITGGNKGLGFEAARRLGERGWTVFLGSRDEQRGRAAADKSAGGGADVVLVPLDLTSDESVADAHRPRATGLEGARARLQPSKVALHMITVRYAQALPGIKFNVVTPEETANPTFAVTYMNNHTGQLTVTEGTDSIITLATIDTDGPTGIFLDRLGPVAW